MCGRSGKGAAHTHPSRVNRPNQYRLGGGGGGGGGNGRQPRLRFEFVKPPAAVSYLEAYDRTAEQLQRRLSKELRGQQDVATQAAEELRGNGCLSKYRSTIATAVSTFQDLPRPGTRCIASCMTRAASEPSRYPGFRKMRRTVFATNGLDCQDLVKRFRMSIRHSNEYFIVASGCDRAENDSSEVSRFPSSNRVAKLP